MSARLKHSRWIAPRIAAAVLGIAALSSGLSACGSDSSSDGESTTEAVVNKEAGILHVQLTLTNETGAAREAQLCDESNCLSGTMENGESQTAYSGGYFKPSGYIKYPDGAVVYFAGQNPGIGEPYVRVSTDRLGNYGPGNESLSEGEVKDVDAAGHTIHLERSGDTDYKVMSVTAR